jgi:hypothetical protein
MSETTHPSQYPTGIAERENPALAENGADDAMVFQGQTRGDVDAVMGEDDGVSSSDAIGKPSADSAAKKKTLLRRPKSVCQAEMLNSPGLSEIRPALKYLIAKQIPFINAELVGGIESGCPLQESVFSSQLLLLYPVTFMGVATLLFQVFDWRKVPAYAIERIVTILETLPKGVFDGDARQNNVAVNRKIAAILSGLASGPSGQRSMISSPSGTPVSGVSTVHGGSGARKIR